MFNVTNLIYFQLLICQFLLALCVPHSNPCVVEHNINAVMYLSKNAKNLIGFFPSKLKICISKLLLYSFTMHHGLYKQQIVRIEVGLMTIQRFSVLKPSSPQLMMTAYEFFAVYKISNDENRKIRKFNDIMCVSGGPLFLLPSS